MRQRQAIGGHPRASQWHSDRLAARRVTFFRRAIRWQGAAFPRRANFFPYPLDAPSVIRMLPSNFRESRHGSANHRTQVDHLLGTPGEPPADRRRPGDRRAFPQRQPQRTGEDDLRAPRLEDGEGRLPGRGVPRHARDAGKPRHPQAARAAGGERPRRGGRRQAGLDLRLGPAAGDRRAPRGPAPAEAGGRRGRGGTSAVERARGPPPLPGIQTPLRGARPVLRHGPGRTEAGLPAVRGGDEGAALPRPLDRLDGQDARPPPAPHGGELPLPGVSMGGVEESRLLGPSHGGADGWRTTGSASTAGGPSSARPSWTRRGSGPPATARPTGSGSARPPPAGESR